MFHKWETLWYVQVNNLFALSDFVSLVHYAWMCETPGSVVHFINIENSASSQNNVGACTCLTGVNFLLCISRQCDVLTNNHDEVVWNHCYLLNYVQNNSGLFFIE